jgi:Putative abortive phage resistance protein AbiGi, antitoxin
MADSNFVAHFTKGKADVPFHNITKILNERKILAGTLPWTRNPAVCFTECPWSSLLGHAKNYSAYGIGFTKAHVFAAGGGPAFYVRADHWEKQQWADHVKTFVTPFWPNYRPKKEGWKKPLGGKSIDYSHEREWRVPHDFSFDLEDIQFVVLPNYNEMARFPAELKDSIGREKFILVDVYKHIESLWPTHVLG